MADDDAPDAVERWLRSPGIPHVVGDCSAGRDVFTRALPALTLVLVVGLLGALNLAWPWWANLTGAAASPAALVLVWALGALARFDSWAEVATLVAERELSGRRMALTAEALQVAGFLTAFSGFYFTVCVLTDATYRKDFLDHVLAELRQAFAVRAVYLAARAVPGG